MSVERLRHALRVLALPVHAQRDGGQAAVEHPAFVRLQDVAEHAAPAADLLDQLADRLAIATPATISLKPDRYLVAE